MLDLIKFDVMKLIAPLVLTLLLVLGCSKDQTNDISQYYVDFTIYLNEPSNVNLTTVNGWIYYPAGTKGIIICRRSATEFAALERNCTFNPTDTCLGIQVISGISAIDSCCNSRFSIIDGSVINGPATRPLYQYRTLFDGNALRIYN